MDLRSALVGREAERARLSQAIEGARRGTGGLLLLSGEAAIGKTQLADEVARTSSALVVRGLRATVPWRRMGRWSPRCAYLLAA